MYSDTSGLKTPVVKELRFAVQPDMAPAAPRRLEIVSAKLGEVVLRLMRNSEMDMINGGRYQIYYGVTPDEPLGVIRFKSIKNESGMWQLSTINDKADRLKTSDPRLQNRLQVTITNEMIMQNLVYFREKPQWKMRYPLIRENVNYYFWVTACDQAFDLTPERADHESEPSDAVFARPDLAYSDAN